MDVSKPKSKEHRLIWLIKKIVQPNKVQDNKLDLASFIKKFLKLCKFWIDGEITLWHWIRGYIIFLLANGVLLMAIAHFIRHLNITDKIHIGDVTMDISLIAAIPVVYVLFATFYSHQKQWVALLEEMGNFEIYEKPDGIELVDMIATARTKISLFVAYMAIPFFAYYFLTTKCEDPTNTLCGFIFPFYFPGCMNNFRPLCALIQLGFGSFLSLISYILGYFYSQFSEYIVIYLLHLQKMLKNISQICNWDDRWIYVQHTIKYHQRILNLYKWYFRLVKNVFLLHVFGTPIILAFLIYSSLTNFHIQSASYALQVTLYLIYVCYFGQKLVNESEALVIVAYKSIPFDGDLRTAKALLLLIHQAQKTLILPAGTLSYCGYDLIVTVCKTMYSYLTLIITIDSKTKH